PLAPVERIMRRVSMGEGVDRISEAAVVELRDRLERIAEKIARRAAIYAKHAGRKTIHPEDVKLVELDF
ncbi:MAG: histone, partial [Candidatus Altiarchaeales archaeon]